MTLLLPPTQGLVLSFGIMQAWLFWSNPNILGTLWWWIKTTLIHFNGWLSIEGDSNCVILQNPHPKPWNIINLTHTTALMLWNFSRWNAYHISREACRAIDSLAKLALFWKLQSHLDPITSQLCLKKKCQTTDPCFRFGDTKSVSSLFFLLLDQISSATHQLLPPLLR